MKQSAVSPQEFKAPQEQVFAVEFNSESYQTVYPEPLSEFSMLFEKEKDAWCQLLADRIDQEAGNFWGVASPERCMSRVMNVLGLIPVTLLTKAFCITRKTLQWRKLLLT